MQGIFLYVCKHRMDSDRSPPILYLHMCVGKSLGNGFPQMYPQTWREGTLIFLSCGATKGKDTYSLSICATIKKIMVAQIRSQAMSVSTVIQERTVLSAQNLLSGTVFLLAVVKLPQHHTKLTRSYFSILKLQKPGRTLISKELHYRLHNN